MQILIEKSVKKISQVSIGFKRSLYDSINFRERLISLKGGRGTGKTTLLLQYLHENQLPLEQKIYLSLDDIFFAENKISEIVRYLVQHGCKCIVLDEVHKYPNWSQEIKNIYDDYNELQVIFTSSSLINLNTGQADLSRRETVYQLNELSFREFIQFKYKTEFQKLSLDDILLHHTDIASEMTKTIKPLKLMHEYLNYGAYPFFVNGIENYHEKLAAVVQTVLETDIPSVTSIDFHSIINLKKLLSIISSHVPFKPNLTDLSRETSIARDTLLRYLHLLEHAGLIMLLQSNASGMKKMAKPEKIYLSNTNLMICLSGKNVNSGTIRETFFMNQVKPACKIEYTQSGDFLLDETYTFEIGGKNKRKKQIVEIPHSFIVSDDIEIGFKNKIPLYLFGFLY